MAAMAVGPVAAVAADLGAGSGPVAATSEAEAARLTRTWLSRYLSLLLIRASFDVVAEDDIAGELDARLLAWAGKGPSAGEMGEIDRQLLAEASYYIVSLSYMVEVGGAVFPEDKAELVYRNDTLVELDGLQRKLVDGLDGDGDVLPALLELERIRALTEGYAEVPAELGILARHDRLLDAALERAARGTAT